MKRRVLDGGRWFDEDAARAWVESQYHDGRNFISRSTGSQWEHEKLFRTKGGRWVVNHWSDWQGTLETHEEVSATEAARWLVQNGYDPHPACETEYAALEVA